MYVFFVIFPVRIGMLGAGLICQFYIVHPREICACCIKITSYIVRERTLMAVWHCGKGTKNASSASECVALFLAFLKMLHCVRGPIDVAGVTTSAPKLYCAFFFFILPYISFSFLVLCKGQGNDIIAFVYGHLWSGKMLAKRNLRDEWQLYESNFGFIISSHFHECALA